MKRTTTEIFIEVEEFVAVRMKEKAVNAENESNHLSDQHAACPVCGQPIGKIIDVKKRELE